MRPGPRASQSFPTGQRPPLPQGPCEGRRWADPRNSWEGECRAWAGAVQVLPLSISFRAMGLVRRVLTQMGKQVRAGGVGCLGLDWEGPAGLVQASGRVEMPPQHRGRWGDDEARCGQPHLGACPRGALEQASGADAASDSRCGRSQRRLQRWEWEHCLQNKARPEGERPGSSLGERKGEGRRGRARSSQGGGVPAGRGRPVRLGEGGVKPGAGR